MDIATLVSLFFALIAGLIGVLQSRSAQRKQAAFEREAEAATARALETFERVTGEEAPTDPALAPSDQVDARLRRLSARLAAIEARLPSEETVDRIASANEARLATKIEHLEKDLARVESKTIGYGAIYTSVFAVIAVLAGVVAVLPWIIDRL